MFRCTFIVITFFGSIQLKSQAIEEFNLKQTIAFALENSISIQQAILDQKQSDYYVKEVKGAGLPQVSANGQFNYYPNIATQLLPGEIIGQPGEMIPAKFGTDFTMGGNFEASQLLFDQRFITGLKAAKNSEQLYMLLNINTEQDVIYEVVNGYYKVLELNAQVEALEDNLKRLEEVANLTKYQYENNLVTKTEFNRLKVNVSNLETQLQTLRTAHIQAKNYLKLLVGMDMNRSVDFVIEDGTLDVSLSVLEYEKETPIQIEVLEKQRDLSFLNKKNSQAMFYPSLTAVASHGWSAQRNEFNFLDNNEVWFPTTNVGVRLSVPIFSGFQNRNRVQQSTIDIYKIDLDLKNLNRTVELEFQNASAQLVNSLKSVETQRENRDLAQEVYDQTQELYQEKVATLNDLLETETSLREARISYFRQVLQFKQAELDLLRAQGQLQQLAK